MSTRGFVAIGKPNQWDGRYNHSDSYPTWLGHEVFKEARRWLRNDSHLHGFAQKLLSLHRWEQFLGQNLDGDENDHLVSENADWLFTEWGYVIDPAERTLTVIVGCIQTPITYTIQDQRPGAPPREWQEEHYTSAVLTTVSLDGEEPVWEAVEQRGYKLREKLRERYVRNPEHPDLAVLRALPAVEVWN